MRAHSVHHGMVFCDLPLLQSLCRPEPTDRVGVPGTVPSVGEAAPQHRDDCGCLADRLCVPGARSLRYRSWVWSRSTLVRVRRHCRWTQVHALPQNQSLLPQCADWRNLYSGLILKTVLFLCQKQVVKNRPPEPDAPATVSTTQRRLWSMKRLATLTVVYMACYCAHPLISKVEIGVVVANPVLGLWVGTIFHYGYIFDSVRPGRRK